MEAHHPHHVTHKKKWTEYLLEFFMLFLAVFLGFVAENVREHFSDKEKEKKYIQTLYFDLKDDTVNLNNNITFWQSQIKRIDTLRSEIKKADHMNVRLINKMAIYVRFYNNFLYHDRTIAQLKSSGNFRLLKTALADSIMEYDSYIVSQLRDQETHGQRLYIEVNNLQNRIFDTWLWDLYSKNGPAYTDSLLTSNPNAFKIHPENKELLFEYYNALNFWQIGIHWRLHSCTYLQRKAVNLVNLIKKQYPLENE